MKIAIFKNVGWFLAVTVLTASAVTHEQLESAAKKSAVLQGVGFTAVCVTPALIEFCNPDLLSEKPFSPQLLNSLLPEALIAVAQVPAAALEYDKSLLLALGEQVSRMVLNGGELGDIDILIAAMSGLIEKDQVNWRRDMQFFCSITRLVSGVAQAAVFNKVNAYLKIKYPTKDEMLKRRVLKLATVLAASITAYVVCMAVCSFCYQYGRLYDANLNYYLSLSSGPGTRCIQDIMFGGAFQHYVLMPSLGMVVTEVLGHLCAKNIAKNKLETITQALSPEDPVIA